MTIVNLDPTNLEFSVFTTEDVRKISVMKVESYRSFDDMGNPVKSGLYDPAMGPCGFGEICATCTRDVSTCEGHFGLIELDLVVYNPFFMRTVSSLLRITCMSCARVQLQDGAKSLLELQLRLADAGYIVEAEEIDVYKTKLQANPHDAIPEEITYYEDLLRKEPYNKLGNTKLSSTIRTAIVNSTLRQESKRCIHCTKMLQRVRIADKKLTIRWTQADKKAFLEEKGNKNPTDEEVKSSTEVVLARESQMFLRKLYEQEGTLLSLLFPVLHSAKHETTQYPTDIFFMEVVPVPPCKMRPVRRANRIPGRSSVMEHAQSVLLRNIFVANATVRAILLGSEGKEKPEGMSDATFGQLKSIHQQAKGATVTEKLFHAWCDLQSNVDQLLDVEKLSGGKQVVTFGLKQLIEKKAGLIRMHMMGKRVNHAARTVITPDPNIGVEEIGIPTRFAKKLTYPVPVTPWNVAELRQWVMNGPDVYPGANMIEDANGRVSKISSTNVTQRQSLAKTLLTPHGAGAESSGDDTIKIVHRHLQNGDILLLNRQPTLHRPSIMAHRAKILGGEKIFRLHYSNCKSYNADFDGDEMNAHLPQNEVARAEAYGLVAVPYQYLVPKDGTPLGGLIQDHIVSAVKLFIRGKFFNREDYQQLVFQALSNKKGNIELLPPSILKPVRLWSGKQIISTIIKNSTPKGMPYINLVGKSKLNNKHWCVLPARPWEYGGTPLRENELSESEVFIRQGELLSGILDKNHFGATPYGLIHCMYELYGGVCSTALLSSLSRLFTYYLQWEGFTLGVRDILVQSKADRKRAKIIRECRAVAGHEAATSALELPASVSRDELAQRMREAYAKNPKFRAILDRKYKTVLDTYTNRINNACLPEGLISKFPENNLQLMVQSGAKGSTVNTMQISCLLGQIELEGKRPPLMISGRSLPSFADFDTSPKSGGFIDGRFMTGIQPQEFFFHCMAGREGLIDTAVKTSRSGYLQRCLVKHLEGLSVHYDMTVRDSDGSVIQYMFGEDGMDIAKTQFIGNEKQTRFLDMNRDVIVQPEVLKRLQTSRDEDPLNEALKKHIKKMKRWTKQNGGGPTEVQRVRTSAFALFSADHAEALRAELPNPDKVKKSGRTKLTEKLLKRWGKLEPAARREYVRRAARCPDPVGAVFPPDSHYGVLSEKLEAMVRKYKRTEQPLHNIDELMQVKGSASLAAPGEPVGVLAAQSIGEPSTQMTLNTFHFAGRGEMNVTLGIPRLREILMCAAAEIKTPSMEIPFLPHRKPERLKAVAEKLRKSLNRVTVDDVLENINIKSKLVVNPSRGMQHIIRFNFLPQDAYDHDYCVTPSAILRHMSRKFFKAMFAAIRRAESAKNVLIDTEMQERKSKKHKKGADTEEDDEIDRQEPEKVDKSEKAVYSDSDSDSDDGGTPAVDGDASDAKNRGKTKDEHDYDEDDENDADADAAGASSDDSGVSEDEQEDEKEAQKQPAAGGKQKKKLPSAKASRSRCIEEALIEEYEKEQDELGQELAAMPGAEQTLNEAEETMFLAQMNDQVSKFQHDRVAKRWCQIVLHMPLKLKEIDFTKVLRDVAAKSVIWEVPRIKRAITYMQNDQLYLRTDGTNMSAMTAHAKVLDLNRLYTNDIHAMANRYGIEAASRVIVKEIQNVFSVYGITIDPRHLLLVADYMTASGRYQAMNRMAMESSVSPLQQISFESSLKFLKEALLKGTNDRLESPSSRLIVGQPCKVGTGSFTLYSSALKDYAEASMA
ncbi:DNA-directed RNA polymerase I subunit RPA1 [Anopheles merus]|uniref:DNA-directed RNA polymerase subunit n=1 Tax=Anopheles merus TaxID=30066 RepID=A0A182UZ14_ANOME|nr:DNA-directed RNA polymerase I subunit RPA1 [Anopheles merus]